MSRRGSNRNSGNPDMVPLAQVQSMRERTAALADALETERRERQADKAKHELQLAGSWAQLENTLAKVGEQSSDIERLEKDLIAAQTEIQKLRFERRAYAEKLDRELRQKHEELVQALQDLATADREIDRLRRALEVAQKQRPLSS